jgi:hypothetical protein
MRHLAETHAAESTNSSQDKTDYDQNHDFNDVKFIEAFSRAMRYVVLQYRIKMAVFHFGFIPIQDWCQKRVTDLLFARHQNKLDRLNRFVSLALLCCAKANYLG